MTCEGTPGRSPLALVASPSLRRRSPPPTRGSATRRLKPLGRRSLIRGAPRRNGGLPQHQVCRSPRAMPRAAASSPPRRAVAASSSHRRRLPAHRPPLIARRRCAAASPPLHRRRCAAASPRLRRRRCSLDLPLPLYPHLAAESSQRLHLYPHPILRSCRSNSSKLQSGAC